MMSKPKKSEEEEEEEEEISCLLQATGTERSI
jgi:hypothetical protein